MDGSLRLGQRVLVERFDADRSACQMLADAYGLLQAAQPPDPPILDGVQTDGTSAVNPAQLQEALA